MDLYWNLSSNRLVTGLQSAVPITAMEFKRRDGAEFRIHFLRSGSQELVEMPSTLDIRFGLKEVGDFGGPVVVFADTFTESDGLWIANPSFNTTELDALFGSDPEEAAVQLIGELTFRNDVGEPWQSTQTFLVTVQNDVIRGDEGTPTDAAPPVLDRLDNLDAEVQALQDSQPIVASFSESAGDGAAETNIDIEIPMPNGTYAVSGQMYGIVMEGSDTYRVTCGDTSNLIGFSSNIPSPRSDSVDFGAAVLILFGAPVMVSNGKVTIEFGVTGSATDGYADLEGNLIFHPIPS
jgi:hypothetical protein